MSDMASLSLSVDTPSQEELANWEAGSPDLLANATVKLAKRVEGANLDTAVAQGVEAFLRGNALIDALRRNAPDLHRSEEHTSELQSLMRISYAVFSLKKKTHKKLITKEV